MKIDTTQKPHPKRNRGCSQKIVNYLQECSKPVSSHIIAEELKINHSTVRSTLHKYNEFIVKESKMVYDKPIIHYSLTSNVKYRTDIWEAINKL